MDKVRFYRILDIDSADEFQYYENLSALLEEEEYIEDISVALEVFDILKDEAII